MATDIRSHFTAVTAQHSLFVMDASHRTIRTEHTFELRALARARFFERSYTWSGLGIERDPHVTSGKDELGHQMHRLHGPVLRNKAERLALIDLGRVLQPGDDEIVSMENFFIDVTGSFDPFLGHTARDGCEEIDLSVTLPPGYTTEVFYEAYHGGSAPFQRERLTGQEGLALRPIYKKRVRTPEIGTNHRLRWFR